MTAMTLNGSAEFTTDRMVYGNKKGKETYFAVAVSLLIHLIVLFGVLKNMGTMAPTSTSPEPQTISVMLISQIGNDSADSEAAKSAPKPVQQVEKVNKVEPKQEPVKATPVLTRPADSPIAKADVMPPATPQLQPTQPAKATEQLAPQAAQATVSPAASATGSASAESSRDSRAGSPGVKQGDASIGSAKLAEKSDGAGDGERVIADALAAYKRGIRQELGNARQYPASARRMGYSGRLVVTLSVTNGIAKADLTGKSPHEELDEMGVKMVEYAIRRTPVPEPLKKTQVSFEVPIVFQLID